MKQIINLETGKVIERELNENELAQQAIDMADHEAKFAAVEQAKIDKELAIAKLAALGITTDDLKALGLGSN